MDRSALAECVLPHTVAVASAFDSRITLAHVMESRNRANWRRAVDPLNWRIRKAEVATYMDDLARRVQTAGVPAETQILEGASAEQIVEFSRTNDVPLIMLSSHGQSGLTGWNVSSVVQKVILRAHTSFMIIRAYQPTSTDIAGLHYHRLLVPVDGSQRAEIILPVVATLARAQDAQIVLTHVIRRPELSRQMPPAREETELADRLVELNQAEAIRYLGDLRSRLAGEIDTRVIVSEHVNATLHDMVDQENIDLVLLSAHGQSGLPRWPFGSTVMSFIAFGTTPLLIMQDLPTDQIESTPAEIAAKEHGRS